MTFHFMADDSFLIVPTAEARVMSQEFTCSHDSECLQRCEGHKSKCINGNCICGGGPKQTVLDAILPSACSRSSECIKFCPPKCGIVRCNGGVCFCEC